MRYEAFARLIERHSSACVTGAGRELMAKPPHSDNDRDHERDHKRPRRKRDGRDRAVIVEIVKQRLEGGAPPTPEAYAKGLEQWQNLPGAITRSPATVKPPTKVGEAGDDSKPDTGPATGTSASSTSTDNGRKS